MVDSTINARTLIGNKTGTTTWVTREITETTTTETTACTTTGTFNTTSLATSTASTTMAITMTGDQTGACSTTTIDMVVITAAGHNMPAGQGLPKFIAPGHGHPDTKTTKTERGTSNVIGDTSITKETACSDFIQTLGRVEIDKEASIMGQPGLKTDTNSEIAATQANMCRNLLCCPQTTGTGT